MEIGDDLHERRSIDELFFEGIPDIFHRFDSIVFSFLIKFDVIE